MFLRLIFHYLADTALGRMLEWVHRHTGARLSFGVLMALSIIWDGIDITLRIFLIPFMAVPIVSTPVRFVLDSMLTIFGAMLWGTPVLLQVLELIVGTIPGAGIITDFIPMLTITGLYCRRVQQESEDAGLNDQPEVGRPLSQEEDVENAMANIWRVLGVVVIFVLFFLGMVGFFEGIGFMLLALLVGSLFGFLRRIGFSAIWSWRGALAAALVCLIGLIISYSYRSSDVEEYRPVAWKEMVKDKDRQYLNAKKRDEADPILPNIGKAGEAAKEAAKSAGKGIARHLEEHDFGIPALNSAAKWLSGAFKPEPKETQPKTEVAEGDVLISEDEVRQLGGKHLAKLYYSDYTLTVAKNIREADIKFALRVCLFSGFISLFLFSYWFMAQSWDRYTVRGAPQPGEQNIDDYLLPADQEEHLRLEKKE